MFGDVVGAAQSFAASLAQPAVLLAPVSEDGAVASLGARLCE